ncbi:hypothetical protein BHECKSOX2_701 [Bathymodiolus heckerae thiotrophic gill symbiont]|nr:hypothetical protein BHECKSOX2_701 [Bathymodiolus heckerae thiotrophic gill symbiont]
MLLGRMARQDTYQIKAELADKLELPLSARDLCINRDD